MWGVLLRVFKTKWFTRFARREGIAAALKKEELVEVTYNDKKI